MVLFFASLLLSSLLSCVHKIKVDAIFDRCDVGWDLLFSHRLAFCGIITFSLIHKLDVPCLFVGCVHFVLTQKRANLQRYNLPSVIF